MRRRMLAGTLLLTVALACSPSDPDTGGRSANAGTAAPRVHATETTASEPVESPSHDDLVKRGRGVYVGHCTACHNMDPSREGSLGPAIDGASRSLLEARVLRNSYPEGYEPKRNTTLMVALPHLNDDIDALVAYLAR